MPDYYQSLCRGAFDPTVSNRSDYLLRQREQQSTTRGKRNSPLETIQGARGEYLVAIALGSGGGVRAALANRAELAL
jgi:hypothetical protein